MYGKEAIMPMEYIVPSLRVVSIAEITNVDHVEDRLLELVQLEEERFVVGFHQNVEKKRQKVWHDRHIKSKHFEDGVHVLMYDNKIFKHPRKLKTHWLGPYVVKEITNGGAVKLQKSYGTEVRGLINGS